MNSNPTSNDLPPLRIRSKSIRYGSPTRQANQTKLNFSWPNAMNSTITGTFQVGAKKFPPIVTAPAWSIHDLNTGELLWEKSANEQREMASLTKIMTCLVCFDLLKRFGGDPETLVFPVSRTAAWIAGTHSGLRENEMVRVIDLFYGMMLPSGNDCALVLAYGFGNMLLGSKKSRTMDKLPRAPLPEFVKEMNKLAYRLGLRSTCFANPHGLSEKGNKSTASELGKIAFHAMEIPLLEKIGSTQSYEAVVTCANGQQRTLFWKNTNKLLEKGFVGLKTGTTPNAGLCLSSVLKKGNEGVIVTLLHAKSENHRWGESEKLAWWGLNSLLSMKDRAQSSYEGSRGRMLMPQKYLC